MEHRWFYEAIGLIGSREATDTLCSGAGIGLLPTCEPAFHRVLGHRSAHCNFCVLCVLLRLFY
jgi:hypothetical protein